MYADLMPYGWHRRHQKTAVLAACDCVLQTKAKALV